MTNHSKDLAAFGRTIGFRPGRVSPGWLSCARGPAGLSRIVGALYTIIMGVSITGVTRVKAYEHPK